MILSLQGCMAVGKTTAIEYLKEEADYFHISYENNTEVIQEIMRRQLDKTVFEDYIEIQKLWISQEIKRWEEVQKFPITVMDFGAEEIEFYTLHYPETIGENWPVERVLKEELKQLRQCMPDRILFLEASEQTLREHKNGDNNRTRHFFDFYLNHFLPLKYDWFIGQDKVDILNVDGLTKKELGQAVKDWCNDCISRVR